MKLFELLTAISHPVLKEENLFELNFNDARVVRSGLDAPINCGFEAETVWENVAEGGGGEVESFYDSALDEYMSNRDRQNIEEAFNEWILESDEYQEAYQTELIEYVNDNKGDSELQEQFLEEENVTDEEVLEFGEQTIADAKKSENFDKDDVKDLENQDIEYWREAYIEEEKQAEFEDWLMEMANEEGEVVENAYNYIKRHYDVDDWASIQYGSLQSMLVEYEIFIDDEGQGVQEVASIIREWARTNSRSSRIEWGDYHSMSGNTKQDFWRVEVDSSISGEGTGAEIISPVYDTPREMLEEMKSLFSFFESEDVTTNRSTGLHVTMSMAEPQEQELNSLKVALLLGDRYLLNVFNRIHNSYTKSQVDKIQSYVRHFMSSNIDGINVSSIKVLEAILAKGIDRGKFVTSHFKSVQNDAGNNLVEFRIAGGNDYHEKIKEIEQAVVRYAVVLQAGYDPEAFKEDYVRSIIKTFHKARDYDDGMSGLMPDISQFDNPIREFLQMIPELVGAGTASNIISYFVNSFNTVDVDIAESREYFVYAMVDFLKIVGEQTKTTINARKSIAFRKVFKIVRLTPKDVLQHANDHVPSMTPTKMKSVVEGMKKMWAGKEIAKIESPTPPAVKFRVDSDSEVSFVENDLLENPTKSEVITKDSFIKMPISLFRAYREAKQATRSDEDTDVELEARIELIERAYDLDKGNYTHLPWDSPYLNDLIQIWERRGVKLVIQK